jgi:hypothetical protein
VFPPPRRITVPEVAEMGVAIDGSDQWWPHSSAPAVLPVFSPYQSQPEQFIDVFNRGSVPFGYRVTVGDDAPWLTATPARGRVDLQQRVTIGVDWTRAPKGDREVPLTVTGPGGVSVEVLALIENPAVPARRLKGFIEANGYVSMEAEHADRAVNTLGVTWVRLPGIGRTGGGMTPFPVTAPPVTPGGAAPRLEYVMTLFTAGEVDVWTCLSPRNSVLTPEGLRYAVSIDDDEPQLVDITEVTGSDDTAMNVPWARTTSDNATVTMTTHRVSRPGRHTLKFWMVDPTVIVQKLVVDTGGLKQSYLGPPESTRR